MKIRRTTLYVLLLVPILGLAGCQTLREIAALRLVDFALGRVTDAELAGVDLSRLRTYEDVRAADVLRISSALAQGRLPLAFTLNLLAENPAENPVQARMVRMDWTLLIDDRETISGVLNENILLPPGQVREIPLDLRLDLTDFFDEGARDLIELALAISGRGGEPQRVKLRAVPTIDTPVGSLRYPEPITIVSREVGG